MNSRQPVVEIIEPRVVEILRQMTPQQRLAQGFAMWDSACVLVRGAVRQEHPDWSDEDVLAESARRLSHGATQRVIR